MSDSCDPMDCSLPGSSVHEISQVRILEGIFLIQESNLGFLHCRQILHLLFLISVRSLPFLSFIMSILAWNVPLITLVFLMRSLVFPILLFSSISSRYSEVPLISPCSSLKLFVQLYIFLAFCFSSFLSYLRSLLWQPTLPSWISFSLRWFWSLLPV